MQSKSIHTIKEKSKESAESTIEYAGTGGRATGTGTVGVPRTAITAIGDNERTGLRRKTKREIKENQQETGCRRYATPLSVLLLKQTGRALHKPFHRQPFLLLFRIGRHLTTRFIRIVLFDGKDILLTHGLGTGG